MKESEKRAEAVKPGKESGGNPAKDPAGGAIAFDPVRGSPIAGGQEEKEIAPSQPQSQPKPETPGDGDNARRLAQAEEERDRALERMKRAEEERDGALRREEKRLREDALRRVLSEKGLSGEALDLALLGLREDAAGFRYLRSGSGSGEDGEDASAPALTLSDESRRALDGLLTNGPLRLLFRLRDEDRAKEAEGAEEEAGIKAKAAAREARAARAEGISLSNPPLGMGIGAPSREEILSIRDGAERRRAIARNPEVFGL